MCHGTSAYRQCGHAGLRSAFTELNGGSDCHEILSMTTCTCCSSELWGEPASKGTIRKRPRQRDAIRDGSPGSSPAAGSCITVMTFCGNMSRCELMHAAKAASGRDTAASDSGRGLWCRAGD